MNRGDWSEKIFKDDGDRLRCLAIALPDDDDFEIAGATA